MSSHPDVVAATGVVEAAAPTVPAGLAVRPSLEATVDGLAGRSGSDHLAAMHVTFPYQSVPALSVRDAPDGMPTVGAGLVLASARSCPVAWAYLMAGRVARPGAVWPDPSAPAHHWLRVARNGSAVRVFGAEQLFGVGPVVVADGVAAGVAAAVAAALPFAATTSAAPVAVQVACGGQLYNYCNYDNHDYRR